MNELVPTSEIPRSGNANGGRGVPALSAEDRALFGLDNLDREDQMLPRVRLAQPMSQLGDAQPGEFHNNLTGAATRELTFVVLRVQKGRVMWPENYQAEQAPLCASDDSRRPRPEYGDLYDGGQGCAKCPMSQWGEDGAPPACSLAYNYLAVDTASGLPCLLSLSRTSARTAKQLNTLFQTFTVTHAIRATAEHVTGPKGRWFEWRVADAGPVEAPQRFVVMARSLAGRALTTDTGDEPEVPADFDPKDVGPIADDGAELPF